MHRLLSILLSFMASGLFAQNPLPTDYLTKEFHAGRRQALRTIMPEHSVAVIFSMLLCVAAFGVLGVLVAAPLVAILEILHDELYRKRFLPTVTNADLDRLARNALREKQNVASSNTPVTRGAD